MIHRLRFTKGDDKTMMLEVEQTIELAFLAAGVLHGESAVRLEASYAVSHDKGTVVVRHEGEAGRTVARLAVGLCEKEYGRDLFTVERVDETSPPPASVAVNSGASEK